MMINVQWESENCGIGTRQTIIKCIWCSYNYKANNFTSNLLNYYLSEIGIFTLHNHAMSHVHLPI